MKKLIIVMLSLFLFVFFTSYYVYQYSLSHYEDDLYEKDTIRDVARLLPTKIARIQKGKEEKQIVEIVKKAKKDNLKISISGKRHSQGGHTYYPNAVVIDMTSYNKILRIDKKKKTVHVQSGATWDDLQKSLVSENLAVKVMQSQNIFTIGGYISANVHGRDIKNDSLGSTINWFRLLLPNGKIVKVNKKENPELFKNVLGGFGLFGVILDVELKVTQDEIYKMKTKKINVEDFSLYVHRLKDNPKIKMAYARISVSPKKRMKKMVVIEYHKTNETFEKHPKLKKLKKEKGPFLTYNLLNLSRKTNFGKNLLWDMQEKYILSLNNELISRNNAMRSESDFLLYKNEKNTDSLQEFFVPIDEYEQYVEETREFLNKDNINLLNFTIRYVSKNDDSRLSYAKDDMIALVALFNHGKSKEDTKKAKKSIRKMIDITLERKGTFYLPYYPYASKKQMKKSYPSFQSFQKQKMQYDPNETFMNLFYSEYKDEK